MSRVLQNAPFLWTMVSKMAQHALLDKWKPEGSRPSHRGSIDKSNARVPFQYERNQPLKPKREQFPHLRGFLFCPHAKGKWCGTIKQAAVFGFFFFCLGVGGVVGWVRCFMVDVDAVRFVFLVALCVVLTASFRKEELQQNVESVIASRNV